MTCRGVDAIKSSPRTTSVTPWAASSTTTARLYAGTPSLRCSTRSSTRPTCVPLKRSSNDSSRPSLNNRNAGRRPSARSLAPIAFGQAPARARVAAGGVDSLRCLRRLADLAPRAVALVDQAGRLQPIDGVAIQTKTFGLADHLAIPVETDAAQRCQLIGLVGRRRRHPVEVLHAHDELATTLARQQPCNERRPEVSQVQ